MRLSKIEYCELTDLPSAWYLAPFELGSANLVVGKNASGKTRALNIIHALARLLRGEQKTANAEWVASFKEDETSVQLEIQMRRGRVVNERMCVNGDQYLTRDEEGRGKLRAEQIKTDLDFKVPPEELATVSKRDLLQHPYLELLQKWATGLRYYPFSSSMGRETGLVATSDSGWKIDPNEYEKVTGLFKSGQDEFGDRFKGLVLQDMHAIGYDLEDADARPLSGVEIKTPLPLAGPVLGLSVKERDLPGWTSQHSISQGMFRALAMLVHLAYATLSESPSCVVVDDIGEGLDFDRSAALVKLLLDRAAHHAIQLVMATNDRFVMNAVPLDAWCVIVRSANRCRILNSANSQALFEEFKVTGLNNFDFFASGFYEGSEGG